MISGISSPQQVYAHWMNTASSQSRLWTGYVQHIHTHIKNNHIYKKRTNRHHLHHRPSDPHVNGPGSLTGIENSTHSQPCTSQTRSTWLPSSLGRRIDRRGQRTATTITISKSTSNFEEEKSNLRSHLETEPASTSAAAAGCLLHLHYHHRSPSLPKP